MPNKSIIGAEFLKELEAEAAASRKCLERIPVDLFDWKPHEKSMPLGYLALLVAEIPKWVRVIAEDGQIDFATFKHFQPQTNAELVEHFDENMDSARRALESITDETLAKTFYLKNDATVLISSPVGEMIGSTINHAVHHRGQLTVYMRLNDIDVPSIYGPSADDKSFS